MDEQLKRRLMGASILVVLAVIFIPMFFEDKSKPASEKAALALPEAIDEHSAELPKTSGSEESASVQSEKKSIVKKGYTVVPLDDSAPKVKATPTKAEVEPVLQSQQPDRSAQEELEAPSESSEDEGAPLKVPEKQATKINAPTPRSIVPKTVTAAPVVSGQEALKAKSIDLNAKKPQVVVAPKPKPSVAPVATPPPARAVETQPVSTKLAPPVAVVKDVPKPPKPSTAPVETQTWVVQAGSFSTETNAKSLVEKLRKRNLPAQMSISQTGAGPVYRVTVGPNLNRARAEQIQKDMVDQDGVKVMILQGH